MASKRAIRRSACTGKVRHPDAAVARIALGKLFKRAGYTGHMNVYRCQFCNGYHIGHAPRKT